MSKDQLLNTKGTNSDVFSLGLGTNKSELKTIQGKLYFRNYQGAWERVATPAQAQSAFIIDWITGTSILTNQVVQYNGSLYIAEIDFTAGATFEDDILNFSKLVTFDHISSYTTTIDSSPVITNNTDADIFILEGTSGVDPFVIRLPPVAQVNLGKTRIVINNSDSILNVKDAVGGDLSIPLSLFPGESATIVVTAGGVWLPFGAASTNPSVLKVTVANSFTVGDVVGQTGGGVYVQAATTTNKIGLISYADAGRFEATILGEVDLTGHPSVPLSPGVLYYIDGTTPGDFTNIKPATAVPVFLAIDTTTALVLPYPVEGAAGGTGSGEITTGLLAFSKGLYKFTRQSKFLDDSDTFIDVGNTTATLTDFYTFNPGEKVTTLGFLPSLYLNDPSEVDRVNVVGRWSFGTGLQDYISGLRVSRDGGNNWFYGALRLLGLSSIRENYLAVHDETNQDASAPLNNGTAEALGQGFQVEQTGVINGARLYLRKVGTETRGRFRYALYSNSASLPSVRLTFSDWYEGSDLSTSYSLLHLPFLFPIVGEIGTTYHIVLELEDDLTYWYVASTQQIEWGHEASGTYTGGSASTFNSSVWSAVGSIDRIFYIDGESLTFLPDNDTSEGEVEIDNREPLTIIDYPSNLEDSSLELNATTQQRIAIRMRFREDIYLDTINVRTLRTGSPSGQIGLYLYEGTSTIPVTLIQEAAYRRNSNTIVSSSSFTQYEFDKNSRPMCKKDTWYWLSLEPDANYSYTGGTFVALATDSSSPAYEQGGTAVWNAGWGAGPAEQVIFSVTGATKENVVAIYDQSHEEANFVDIDDGTSRERLAVQYDITNDKYLYAIDLPLVRIGTPGATVVIDVMSDNANLPNAILYTSDPVDIDTQIDTTLSRIRFSFPKRIQLTSGTTYWFALRTIGTYTYSNGVTEVSWPRDDSKLNSSPARSATFASSVWSSNTEAHTFYLLGYDNDVRIEVTGIKDLVELTHLGAEMISAHEFQVTSETATNVALSATMISSGVVPIGIGDVTGGVGDTIAIIGANVYVSGISFTIVGNDALFDPTLLSGETQAIFIKNVQSVSFSNKRTSQKVDIDSLPTPVITKFDVETIQFDSPSGQTGWKVNLPDGPVYGFNGARVSFNSSKNRYGGIGLDTGSESGDTEYYVYAVRREGSDVADIVISTDSPSSGLTGYSNWTFLCRFWNDSGSDILYPFEDIVNMTGIAGWGSTDTKIPQYSSVSTIGSKMTPTNNATNGGYVTIDKDGLYYMSHYQVTSAGNVSEGVITINSSDLTTLPISVAINGEISRGGDRPPVGTQGCVSIDSIRYLYAGDVVRVHGVGANESDTTLWYFTVQSLGGTDPRLL